MKSMKNEVNNFAKQNVTSFVGSAFLEMTFHLWNRILKTTNQPELAEINPNFARQYWKQYLRRVEVSRIQFSRGDRRLLLSGIDSARATIHQSEDTIEAAKPFPFAFFD